jgi:hypothetical protein
MIRLRFLLICLASTLGTSEAFAKFSVADLRKLLANRTFTRVEDFVAALPEEMRRNFILQAGTDSPQSATATKPRVILFSEDGQTILAFKGGAEGPSLIEVSEFDEINARFVPHLVDVNEKGSRFIDDPLSMFPHGHARNCATCHGEEFRPVWDSYKGWRHSFGSGAERALLEKGEIGLFKQFLASEKTGIYKHLIDLDKTTLESLERRNAIFTALMNRLNEKRIFNKIKNNPFVQRYARQIFLTTYLDGEEYSRMIPAHLQKEYEVQAPKIRAEIDAAIQAKDQDLLKTYLATMNVEAPPPNPGFFEVDRRHVNRYTRLRFLMDQAGISMADWNMTIQPSTYSFGDPTSSLAHFRANLMDEVIRPAHPEFADGFKAQTSVYERITGNDARTEHIPVKEYVRKSSSPLGGAASSNDQWLRSLEEYLKEDSAAAASNNRCDPNLFRKLFQKLKRKK